MSRKRDAFIVEGLCWCPGERSLAHFRAMGHTEDCTRARKGWEANNRHAGQMARRRAEERALGHALLTDARKALAGDAE